MACHLDITQFVPAVSSFFFFSRFFSSLSPKCSSLLYDFFASILLNYPFNSNRIEALLQALIGFGIRVATSMRKSSA